MSVRLRGGKSRGIVESEEQPHAKLRMPSEGTISRGYQAWAAEGILQANRIRGLEHDEAAMLQPEQPKVAAIRSTRDKGV